MAQYPFTLKDLLSAWGRVPIGFNADLNHDEWVNGIDFAIYLSIPLSSPTPHPTSSPSPAPSISPSPTTSPPLDTYQCRGFIKNSLCYYGTEPIIPTTIIYDDTKAKITAEYLGRTELNSEFTARLSIENKTSQTLNLVYYLEVSSPENFYQVQEFTNFPGATGQGSDYVISLSPNSSELASGRFVALRPNIFSNNNIHSGHFITFKVRSINGSGVYHDFVYLKSVTPFSSGAICGDGRFPQTYDYQTCIGESYCGTTDEYRQSKCCNGVFYPGFDCCSSADCSEGSMCIDGRCKAGMGYYRLDKAFGTKETLFVMLDSSVGSPPNIQTSCSLNNEVIRNRTDVTSMINSIEAYFDEMAQIHIQKSADFLNFNFDLIGPFWLSQLGLDSSTTSDAILNTIEQRCGLTNTRDTYVEIIISGLGIPSIGSRGLAGKPLISEFMRNSIVHEIAHNFGCFHINSYDMGTTLQWASDLMGWSRRHDVNIAPTLQVCRGEMGWIDFNHNGLLDIQE